MQDSNLGYKKATNYAGKSKHHKGDRFRIGHSLHIIFEEFENCVKSSDTSRHYQEVDTYHGFTSSKVRTALFHRRQMLPAVLSNTAAVEVIIKHLRKA